MKVTGISLILPVWVFCLGLFQLIYCDQQLDRDVVLDNEPHEVNNLIYQYGLIETLAKDFDFINKIQENKKLQSNIKEKKSFFKRSKKHKSNKSDSDDQVEQRDLTLANELITKLNRAQSDCGFDSYVIYITFYKILIGQKRTLQGDRPLELQFMNSLKRHGDRCRPTYIKSFNNMRSIPPTASTVDWVLNDKLLNNLIGDHQDDDGLVKTGITQGRLRSWAPYIFDRMVELIESQSYELINYKNLSFWKGKKGSKFIDEPCEGYVKSLKNIFYPAALDLVLDPSKISEINPSEDKQFMKTWTRFHICSVIYSKNSLLDEYLVQEFKRRYGT